MNRRGRRIPSGVDLLGLLRGLFLGGGGLKRAGGFLGLRTGLLRGLFLVGLLICGFLGLRLFLFFKGPGEKSCLSL